MLVELKYYLDDKSLNNWTIEISGIISNSKITNDENLEVIYINDDNLIEDRIGNIIGEKLIIRDVNQMSKVLSRDFNENIKYLYVELDDWKIIPLENLIAKLNEINIELISSISNLDELILFEKILEIGLNGVILKINSPEEKHKIEDYILKKSSIKLRMEEFEVTKIQDLGLGDRVCVDTISNLKKGEGMLVGSAASLQVLIEAEVHEVGYVEPRPFRVNAGSVANYTLNFDKTNYLSELKSGMTVMVVDKLGGTKKEHIARVKIEKRPLTLVELQKDQIKKTVILQNAETVNFVTNTDSIPIHKLKIGDKVLGHYSNSARHFGMKVDETIEER